MNIKNIISLIGCFGLGFASGYFVLKKRMAEKYLKTSENEIESMKQFLNRRKVDRQKTDDAYDKDKIVSELNRTTDLNENLDQTPSIYLIDQDAFGENDEYSSISCTYYSDGILADDIDLTEIDIEKTIGSDLLQSFLKPEFLYGVGAVYVRNDRLREDYEITGSTELYSSIHHRTED